MNSIREPKFIDHYRSINNEEYNIYSNGEDYTLVEVDDHYREHFETLEVDNHYREHFETLEEAIQDYWQLCHNI